MRYSAHGSELIGNLRVYHQGGLDTYCGFYAILNLINFLQFKERTSDHDFIGANEFTEFLALIRKRFFQRFFPTDPFGGEGIEAKPLSELLNLVLKHFHLGAKAAKAFTSQGLKMVGATGIEPVTPPLVKGSRDHEAGRSKTATLRDLYPEVERA
jgi:hypothetical protein